MHVIHLYTVVSPCRSRCKIKSNAGLSIVFAQSSAFSLCQFNVLCRKRCNVLANAHVCKEIDCMLTCLRDNQITLACFKSLSAMYSECDPLASITVSVLSVSLVALSICGRITFSLSLHCQVWVAVLHGYLHQWINWPASSVCVSASQKYSIYRLCCVRGRIFRPDSER